MNKYFWLFSFVELDLDQAQYDTTDTTTPDFFLVQLTVVGGTASSYFTRLIIVDPSDLYRSWSVYPPDQQYYEAVGFEFRTPGI